MESLHFCQQERLIHELSYNKRDIALLILASVERFQPMALPLCKPQRRNMSRVFTIFILYCSIIS